MPTLRTRLAPMRRLRTGLWTGLWTGLQVGLSIVLASLPARAGVLKVDPNGGPGVFTSIQAAVNAAQSGDTILVAGDNSYPAFVIDAKGLQVVVDLDDYADIEFEVGPGIVVRNLPAGAPVVLRGLRSGPAPFPLGDPRGEAIAVENCAADVWLEDCEFNGANGYGGIQPHKAGWSAIRVINCNSVGIVRSTLQGGRGFSPVSFFIGSESAGDGAHGIDATSSSAYVYDSTLAGGNGGTVLGTPISTFPGGDGGHGAALNGAFLFASGSPCIGGTGGSGGYSSASGACGAGGDGGHGLHLAANAAHAVRLDSVAIGGLGGTGGGGQGGPPGCAPDGVAGQGVKVEPGGLSETFSGSSRSLVQSAVTREQGNLALLVQGESGDVVFLLVGVLQDSSWIPNLKGALLPAKAPLLTIGLGSVPASGVLAFDFTIPELGPGFDAIWVYDQAALSSAAHGWVLTSPTASLLLDQSL